MIRVVLATALALAVFAVPYSAFAHIPSRAYGNRPQAYDGTYAADAYSNCLPWSAQLQIWVWVCGPPYPPNIPVLHQWRPGKQRHN